MNHLKLVFVLPEIPNFPYFYEKVSYLQGTPNENWLLNLGESHNFKMSKL